MLTRGRYKTMPKAVQERLREPWPEDRIERAIEQKRRGALRASWLDLRSPSNKEQRGRAMYAFYISLRGHLIRVHEVSDLSSLIPLREPSWVHQMGDLDAMHERLHGRAEP